MEAQAATQVAETPTQTQAPEGQEPSKIEGAETSQEAQAAEVAKRMLKLKVHGIEEELPEDEVIRRAQLGTASTQVFQEAAKMRKQTLEFLSQMKDKKQARKILKDLGIDTKALAEEWLGDDLRLETMDPKDRRIYELERAQELAAFEKEEQQKALLRQEEERLSQQLVAEYQKDILTCLEKNPDLPRTPETIRRFAHSIEMLLAAGFRDPKAEHVVDNVRESFNTWNSSYLKSLSVDQLMKILGPERLKEIRQKELSNLKTGMTFPKDKAGDTSEPKKKDAKKITMQEWRERNQRIKAGLE